MKILNFSNFSVLHICKNRLHVKFLTADGNCRKLRSKQKYFTVDLTTEKSYFEKTYSVYLFQPLKVYDLNFHICFQGLEYNYSSAGFLLSHQTQPCRKKTPTRKAYFVSQKIFWKCGSFYFEETKYRWIFSSLLLYRIVLVNIKNNYWK